MDKNVDLNPDIPSPEGSGITIRLDEFEGPLDLLLYLIKREELDIRRIPIARVTEQYLEYLHLMKDLNINVAGEWLVMAATLIYIKSRILLPPEFSRDASEEPAEDARKELVYQLLEHQKFKNAAQMLYTREELEQAVWNRPPQEAIEDSKGVVTVTLFGLLHAFGEIVKRLESQHAMELDKEEVSIEEKLADLRRLLLVHDSILFSALFAQSTSKRHLIVTLLALLELARLREVWLYQKKSFDEIHIAKGKPRIETA